MPGVTSLSVLFLLLALCPLNVAGYPEDLKVMFLQPDRYNIAVLDITTKSVTNLINTTQPVSAFDYDPVNEKVYWCSTERMCYVQDYNRSTATELFNTDSPVEDIQVDNASTLYYMMDDNELWVKRHGDSKKSAGRSDAFTVDKVNGRAFIKRPESGQIDVYPGKLPIDVNLGNADRVFMSWNPSDSLLYFTLSTLPADIKSVNLYTGVQNDVNTIRAYVGSLSAYRDVVVLCVQSNTKQCQLGAAYTGGGTVEIPALTSAFWDKRPVLFGKSRLSDEATTDQSSTQVLHNVFIWTPSVGCLQTKNGTSIKVTLTPGLEDFSLLVIDPPNECSPDLGKFREDITIPEACVVAQKVEVAIQLTEIKDILGGRFFRHFLFSCSELGPDGKAVELTTDNNPNKTQATASNTSYADGVFSLMVVTSDDVGSDAELTSATDVIWSQDGVFLVLRHHLAAGSQHRTLIPAECTINSTSHRVKKTIWRAKPDTECEQEMGLIDAWTIQSKRTLKDDVTYTQLFPFDFQVGEKVTITCDARECPYVADAGELQGKCLEAFEKYKECGGTFRSSSSRRRREVTSLSGNGSAPLDQEASRVMSASFTLV